MRTVPRSPSLNPALRKCSTNPGKSVEPVSGDHSTACPFSPAIEVNVPHSCAVSPKKPPGSPNPSTPPKLSGSLQEERRTSRARNSCSWPASGNSQRFVSRPLPFQTPTGPPLLTTELGLDTERNSLRLQRPRLLQPLPEVRLPTLRQCRYSQGA